MTPGEINAQWPDPVYRCRGCRTTENLVWFNGTSCPVCQNPSCIKALWEEWDAAYYQDEGEY